MPTIAVRVSAAEAENADEQRQSAEVDAMINRIGELRAKQLLEEEMVDDSMNRISSSGKESQIQTIENELLSLGVDILTKDEVDSIVGENSVRAVVPDTTTSVRWYSYTSTYTYSGEEYVVQRVYAQGRTSASNLCVIDSGKTLYDCEGVAITENTDILSIYVSKAVGMIPWLSYLPYELTGGTFTYLSGTVDEVCSATYSIVGTVCFSYVYPEEDGESAQMLSYVSTSFNMSATVSVAGMQNGQTYAYSCDDISGTTSATNYASLSTAVESYVYGSTSTGCSYVHYIRFYGPDGQLGTQVNLPQPSYPIHIY